MTNRATGITRNLIVAISVAVAAFVYAPAPAEAVSVQTGRVVHVSDGDTFTVELSGGKEIRIRNTGINTMETGQCHAQDAEDRLRQLIHGKTVTLKARSLSSMSGERYWRWVFVGTTDINRILVREGLAVPFPHPYENLKNKEYLSVAKYAAAERRGIWASDACGQGPDQDNALRLRVQWDAPDDDKANINGEYVRIYNSGADRVELTGWWLRDAVDHYYYFKPGASIPARGRITVKMGRGTDTSTTFYAGFTYPPFGNVPLDKSYGDGAFLLDPHGDIRAWMTYPCISHCSDRLKGKISITAKYDPSGSPDDPRDEWVKVTNVSSSTIDLAGYLLEVKPYIYDFDRFASLSSRLRPNEYMRVYIGKGSGDTRRVRYWDLSEPALSNGGDWVRVRTFDLRVTKCKDWGDRNCPAQ